MDRGLVVRFLIASAIYGLAVVVAWDAVLDDADNYGIVLWMMLLDVALAFAVGRLFRGRPQGGRWAAVAILASTAAGLMAWWRFFPFGDTSGAMFIPPQWLFPLQHLLFAGPMAGLAASRAGKRAPQLAAATRDAGAPPPI